MGNRGFEFVFFRRVNAGYMFEVDCMSLNLIPRVPDGVKKIVVDDLRRAVDGRVVFITGGTGFVGKWLLELIYWGWKEQGVRPASLVIAARRPNRLLDDVPHLSEFGAILKAVAVDLKNSQIGDCVNLLSSSGIEKIDAVIHTAVDASSETLRKNPLNLLLGNIKMMELVLEVARKCSTKSFLFTSSGAAYGSGTNNPAPWVEGSLCAPDTMSAREVYGECKRCAEMMLACEAESGGVKRALVARLFTFIGPYLPLDGHFAVSCFMRDALSGVEIIVKSPEVVRSYLHGFEMASALMAILARGESRSIYNIGSNKPVDMFTLAYEIGSVCGKKVKVNTDEGGCRFAGNYYLPSMEKTWRLCGYRDWLSLKECVQQTIAWHLERSKVK